MSEQFKEIVKQLHGLEKAAIHASAEAIKTAHDEIDDEPLFCKWQKFNKKYLELDKAGRKAEAKSLYDKFLRENGE